MANEPNDKPDPGKHLSQAALHGGSSAATALAKGIHDPLAIAIDAAGAAAPDLYLTVRDTYRLILARWAGGVSPSLEDGPHADPAENVREHLKDPKTRRTLFDSWQRMLEAIDDQAGDLICLITSDYVKGKKPVDSFFRGTTRMLADLGTESLAGLREIVEGTLLVAANDKTAYLMIERLKPEEESIVFLNTFESGSRSSQSVAFDREATEVFRLLKVNGLGRDMPTGGFVAEGGPNVLLIEPAVLRRLGDLFDRLPRTTPASP